MAINVKKGLIAKDDLFASTAASRTFSRLKSDGTYQTLTAVAATHIPLIQGAASLWFTANNVQRAVSETISRHHSIDHSTATYSNGARVGDHVKVMGFRNAAAATSIQAAASNAYLRDGVARIIIPNGTFTAATPIQLPRKTWIYGNGKGTIIRASSTIQTSRVFSISGSVAATNTTTSGVTYSGATTVVVSSGSGINAGDWIFIQSGTWVDMQKVTSKSGTTLTIDGEAKVKHASGSTVKLVYPAELYIDNMEIQLSSATQGRGVAATYLVQSRFGDGLRIIGAANEGVLINMGQENIVDSDIISSKSQAAGKGYGVRFKAANLNISNGNRTGARMDAADGAQTGNWLFGYGSRAQYGASGMMDPLAYWYRHNKPVLSYVSYASTYVVACEGSSSAPSQVYIDGKVYTNKGTILCDLSRTITPANATVGGMDRGPVTATRAFYIYGVPSKNASSTRQWDMVGSAATPSSGPTASATFPQWTWLGAVNTGATLRILHFKQNRDSVIHEKWVYHSDSSTVAQAAAWTAVTSNQFPVGIKTSKIISKLEQPSPAELAAGYYISFSDENASNINEFYEQHIIGGNNAASNRYITLKTVDLPISSARQFKWINNFPAGGATLNWSLSLAGYTLNRGGYK